MILIGYSGHAFVVYGILKAGGKAVQGYCDAAEKASNPFQLDYLGPEFSESALEKLRKEGCFIAVGDNAVRKRIFDQLNEQGIIIHNAIHPSAVIDHSALLAENGVMVAAHASINPLARIGKAAICNTGCIIEHECEVGDFVHIGPGAVLCGNVRVGECSFVGANAVVKQGIRIGKNVMIGAGAVVVKHVADNALVMGNPGKEK